MRILALVPGGISDQLLFFPVLEDIKKVYSKAEIAVVAEPKAVAAYRVSKIVDTVLPFAFSGTTSPSDWANLLGLIRDREYEVAISSNTKWGTGLLLWLSGVPTRITYDTTRTPWFYTALVPDKSQAGKPQYQAERYHDLLSAININTPTALPTINVPEGDIAWANALRDRLQLKNGYVLMYPGPATGIGDRAASYPTPSWQALIKDFRAKQPNLPVVVLQTNDSAEQVNQLKQADSELVVATATNLGQTAAFIAGADLAISPDSHIMQLAVALKVFTLALFGSNQPEEMLPPTEGEETRFLGISSPTGKITDIEPQTVLQKVWGG
ncbi:MAG: ADP-heptose:LPS heptosyltransferase [Phormidesmis priestleyi Ana]|uniref:ADP-heptose:LPS heptosyltransferase n=1 Tax=Phormidesmis priestleyi Ana TaxID=1666911 RepID=A0A0P7Z006_9CYAN|nr:MAG: ADP-heptose:LPS heptosyltransferase [Phormidesmis priestleyi Ana]